MINRLRQYILSGTSAVNGRVTRLGIFVMDILLAFLSFMLAVLVLGLLDWNAPVRAWMPGLGVLISLRIMSALYFRNYALIIRFIGEKDYWNVIWSVHASSLAFLVLQAMWRPLIPYPKWVFFVVLDGVMLIIMMSLFRLALRVLHTLLRRSNESRIHTAIFGAGELGALTQRVMEHHNGNPNRVVAFFDDNPKVHEKFLNGVPIYNPVTDFEQVVSKLHIKVAVIAINVLPEERRVAFINQCLEAGVKVLKVPSSDTWLGGGLSLSQLREIRYEDLLNRPAIQLDQEKILGELQHQVVMVTGCAGSIGSEIVRQVMQYGPKHIIGIDHAETPLAEQTLELSEATASGRFVPVIASVRDAERMERLFEQYRPEVVFHAAAYKHVPVMESFPEEAIKGNVRGTLLLADLASRWDVGRFVMVSTDKVVRPTNVMGASKRIAEMYVQSLNFREHNRTRFVTTRFGNVLGSNGSVVPIFRDQIEQRKPVTVTHPEVSRFFMTIPEACQLVLEAGMMGEGGEIFVFDMGEPLRIVDFAHKMIRMAGLTPGVDIAVQFTGLRPGEKLREELLDDAEGLLPTHHEKILRASVRHQDYNEVKQQVEQLIVAAQSGESAMALVCKMRAMVPEYVPQNEAFQEH
jgi:FlaA1/EpsC-like NDP-sugar epimerase